MKKIFAIGDIHGCIEKIAKLIDRLPISNRDTLVFLGDYIDRGHASKEVIQFLIGLTRDYNTIFLRGNHEDMMLKALAPGAGLDENAHWLMNGGWDTVKSYGGDISMISDSHMEFFKNTLLYYEEENYVFVHAGANPTIPLAKHDPKYLMWVRESFIGDTTPWGKTVIFGHTPQSEPLVMNNKIGIDTGCVFGRTLTCLELPGEIFHTS